MEPLEPYRVGGLKKFTLNKTTVKMCSGSQYNMVQKDFLNNGTRQSAVNLNKHSNGSNQFVEMGYL